MAAIELITLGITAEDLVAKINEIIAALNGIQPVSSYNDLENKPTINGVTVAGDIGTADLHIRIADADDFQTYSDTWATKEYVNESNSTVLESAEAAVRAALDSKMDKDLSNLDTAAYLGDDGYVPVVVGGNLVKMTVKDMAEYGDIKKESAKSAIDSGVASQRKYIPLEGEQDGSNIDFGTETGFVLGTTALYLNGQLLTRNYDYTEQNSYQIKMLSHIPVVTDILTLMAVPLA